jgi:hypothetical protein
MTCITSPILCPTNPALFAYGRSCISVCPADTFQHPRSVNVWTIVWTNITKIIALEDVSWSAPLTLITSPITTNVWINVQKDGSLIILPEFAPRLVMPVLDISHISPRGCVCLCVPTTLTLTKEYVYRLV